MRRYDTRPRAQRLPRAARQIAPAVTRSRAALRPSLPALRPAAPAAPAVPLPVGPQADPYLDYSRTLTLEGGVLIVYKDLDLRLRHIFWRFAAWTTVTGLETWFLCVHSPLHNLWIGVACLLAVATVNVFIVAKPVEIYCSVEIRPDCMVLGGSEVFWLSRMENGWPAFQPDEEGNLVLSGIYGTRFVEYLTARRFDEYDRMPEVFAAHWQQAVQQLWEHERPERHGR